MECLSLIQWNLPAEMGTPLYSTACVLMVLCHYTFIYEGGIYKIRGLKIPCYYKNMQEGCGQS